MVYTKNDGLLNKIYPVGSIYMSTNDISPEDFLGGIWERWGQGRVPVCVNPDDTDFAEVEKEIGEKTHTLIYQEMPTHKHKIKWSDGNYMGLWLSNVGSGSTWEIGSTWANGDSVPYATTATIGNSQPHNNIQPSITCYMWKRTA